jgi:hypothetical protein
LISRRTNRERKKNEYLSIHKICILIVPKTNVKNVPNNSSNVDDFCSPAAYFFPWFSSYNVSFNPLAI